MPDPPPVKRRPQVGTAAGKLPADAGRPYAELHAKTNFSFLEGASHPDELVVRAAELGYAALAITDRNSLAGVVRAHVAAKETGLKLLVGAEITLADAPPLVLLATDRAAYARLSQLITLGRRRAPKGECQLCFEDLGSYAEGLLALMPRECGVRSAECGVQARSGELLHLLHDLFPDRLYLLAELHQGPDDAGWLAQLLAFSRRTGVPLAAAGDVLYHDPARGPLHDVLTAIRTGLVVAAAGEHRLPNYERHLQPRGHIARRFTCCPQAVARTIEIADRCRFSLDELRYEYPHELAPPGSTPLDYLTRLTWEGARDRYPVGVPERVRRLIEHELALIAELRYEAYFLTVWDLVRFARSRGILCQGRGSAANSAVCYCLGVTAVDPERMDVLFERFISRERNEAPDIDVDFEHERREEVLQYVYDKYGRDRAAMTAEVITYRPRSAVRDVAKALGLSADRVDRLAKGLDHYSNVPNFSDRLREAGLAPDSFLGDRLQKLVAEILGFPRHLSQHVGGMVVTRGPVWELVPIENAAMPGRTVIEWDKDDLDELGILKVDCLALGMLTAIRKCFDLVQRHYGRRLSLADVPPEDPAVYDMIGRADTMGVFQIESRAQMSMLPRLRPRTFYDLVIEVAIVRPGPIQGKMVHPYLRRRAGEEPVEYPNEAIREVLKKTLGVPLFQEQAMRLAVVAAGFTPGEADQLRRAMGAWRKSGVIDAFRQKLLEGMQARGLPAEYALRVFEQIRGFGEYGFPESHAASFALLVYVSAWLKHYYPAAFACALLNSQPMGFYAPAQLVRDARQHGVEVLPWDVNESGWDCALGEVRSAECGVRSEEESRRFTGSGVFFGGDTRRNHLPLDPKKTPDPLAAPPASHSALRTPHSALPPLRLGLRLLSGLSQAAAKQIAAAHQSGLFHSLTDFSQRTGLGQGVLVRLARAGAFGSLGLDRRQGLWAALAEVRNAECGMQSGRKMRHSELPLHSALRIPHSALPLFFPSEPPVSLSPLSPQAEVLADYRTAGLSLRAHPVSFFRPRLEELKVLRAEQLAIWPAGRQVRVAGVVLVRQRPGTASGITFVTLEDETGTANLIVRPQVWERYRRAARQAAALLAHGRLERQGLVIHVLVNKLEDLTPLLGNLPSTSRDFR